MAKSVLRLMAAIVILAAAAGTSVMGQFGFSERTFAKISDDLLVDHAYFRTTDSSLVRLEIYYQIQHRGLTFSLAGNNYTASYELVVVVEDDDEEIVKTFTRDRQVVIPADDEARTRVDFRTSQINVDLTPGKYKVRFTLKDRSSGETTFKELRVKLEELYHRRPRLSPTEFAQAFRRMTEQGSVFSKGDMLVVPSVHRVFGGADTGRVSYYFEVYPGSDELDKVIVETKIRHHRKGMLYRDTLHLALSDRAERQLREISLAHFLPGEYELNILLRGRRNKLLAEKTQRFNVAWTEEGMIRNDWKSTINQLKLFSGDVDVGDMEKLRSHQERLEAFNQFWLERDPSEGTLENEAKVAFYHRIRVANERFGIMKVEGWRSDRGRIYIRHGEPDYLDDEPFAPDRLPYQVWHYVAITPDRHFLFIDENQDGDYRLQYPFDGLGRVGGY